LTFFHPTFEMSGSDEIRFTNFVIAFTPSNIPSSILISKICAPFSTCNLAILNASWNSYFMYVYYWYFNICIRKRYWISEWLLFNAKWKNFQVYNGEIKLHSIRWWLCHLCTRQTRLVGITEKVSWFRVNHSLLFLLNAAYLAEIQQIHQFFSLWFDSTRARTHDLPH
jgi:hypothetical protein